MAVMKGSMMVLVSFEQHRRDRFDSKGKISPLLMFSMMLSMVVREVGSDPST